MRILLIHPEDDPEQGPWSHLPWDRVVDLGLGGASSYARWSQQFQCPVTTLHSLRRGFDDFRHVRDLQDRGWGSLTDEHGLDWWEILSLFLHGELESLILLRRFVESVSSGDEVHVSRPGFDASVLHALLPSQVHVFPLRREAQKSGLAHYLRVSKKLSVSQIIDIFWDKSDVGYQFRGRFRRKRARSVRPVVLLPSAYINVSRTGIAYANTFPGENFLLVSTRRSGWVQDRPQNVAAAWLSSYASVRDRGAENSELESRWRRLLKDLVDAEEFEILNRLGYLESFPRRLRDGLEVRDAWRNVLDTEPVQAVLCADDSNPYTRIPLLLAQARGLPNIACHHGALDGRYVFKRVYGDIIWAKGRMEEDYLVRRCGVPQERVEIGAPALGVGRNALRDSTYRPCLLFISEAFEVSGGRVAEFYRDTLPPLANLALATGHKLVVKLHPAESVSERSSVVAEILSSEQKSVTRIVTGPLAEDLLASAWFGITILSTVAIECALRGIPCFLCKWLESWPYGYVEQFIRFGVGVGLNHPSEIAKIPDYLEQYPASPNFTENYWHPIASNRLREVLTAPRKALSTATQ